MNKISTIATALMLLCSNFQSANAGLLGMPLNLKAAILQVNLDGSASTPIFRQQFQFFYTDDVLSGSLISSC
jgi:hypothetical protein